MLSTFVTDAKVKGPHEIPVITVHLSVCFPFDCSFILKGGKYKVQ